MSAAPVGAADMPDLVPPMLPTKGELPDGDGWVVELAWDGHRCLAYAAPGRTTLRSGSGRVVTEAFPELAEPLAGRAPRRGMVLDGTVVALGEDAIPRRRWLLRRSATRRPSQALLRRSPVGFLVSDLLWLDGRDTTGLAYRHRRELLAQLHLGPGDSGEGPVVLSPSFPAEEAAALMAAADSHGADALYAKHLDAPYRPGKRTRAWLRVPLRRVRQVVVGGWNPADPRRPGSVAALLLGVPDGDGLRYVGRVGIGAAERREAAERLTALRTPHSPFTTELPASAARDAAWVTPRLTGSVEFADWTVDGRLRTPIWRGFRDPSELDGSWAVPPAGSSRTDDPAPAEPELTAPAAGPGATGVEARRLSQHFTYNALNTIASLVRTDPARARELLLGFADLTRATDQDVGTSSTLGQELAAVRAYLALEQARFGRRLSTRVADDPALHDVPVAALQVLTAVRTVVQQGIEPRPEGGTIVVTAEPAAGGCVVRVTDEGAGEAAVLHYPAPPAHPS